jgi:cytochrome P450
LFPAGNRSYSAPLESDQPVSEHDYDLLDLDAHVDDPWPMYTYLREQAPLYWDQHNELWAVSRHADIVAMSTDTDTFTSGEGALANIPGDPSMIHQYPEQHGKQRRLVSSAFTPSRMRTLEATKRRSSFIRGLTSLPVVWEAAS